MATTRGHNSNRMERLTTCPICLDKFRIPKVLPCTHKFCLAPCLTNLVDPRARSLRCPECRREHMIPRGGIQAFPADLTMIGFFDTQPSPIINPPDRCSHCKQQRQTLIKCHDCSKFFCGDCREPHLRETFFNISSSISQLRRTLPKLSDKISSYEQRVNSVKTNYEQIRREITSTIVALIDELKHRETALLTEAEAYMQSQLRTFRIQQETAEVELANVANFCESVGTSFPNGQLITDVDLAHMRSQSNLYAQQIDALQAQISSDVQKLRFTFNDQAAISSAIQNLGRLIDGSQGQQQQQQQQQQQSQTSISQVAQFQQQPQFSPVPYPQTATQYATPSRNPLNIQEQSQNNQRRHSENLYYSNGSVASQAPLLSQTIAYRPTQIDTPRNTNNPFADLSLTVPARTTTSSYTASWDQQAARRSTSNVQSTSIFGPNPFAASNSRQAQQSTAPPAAPPEPSPRRQYVTSTTAARSLEGDDRPIFGGRGSGGGGGGRGGGAMRGRGRASSIAPIPEQQSLTNDLQRQGTFMLDQPTLPNLPQSGAQKPRDTVIVRELYKVRRRNRARTPVAFTINLNEGIQSPSSQAADNATG
ncbi:unnamed protein product [Rotaria sordida]|uniref:RING-type domain-containing protein n=1 Tax=Rotaria sordida TaxID=392033 RepID=A0A814XN37_9BILA|nr:unnamed protein product [Rotaria sordida]